MLPALYNRSWCLPDGSFDRLEEFEDIGQAGYTCLDSWLVENIEIQSNGHNLRLLVFYHKTEMTSWTFINNLI